MTFHRFVSIATSVVPVLLLFGIATGAYYYRYLEGRYRFLLLYFVICLSIDVLSRFAGELYGNNLIFIIIFSLLEFLFFYLYYTKYFFKRRMAAYTTAVVLACSYMLFEMCALKDVSPKEFQPYSKVICSFLIIIMALKYLFEKIVHEQQESKMIKLNSVFVVYFSLNLIFFLPVNFLINVNSSVKFYFWCANLLLTIAFYTFLSREIWKNGLTRKQFRSGS